jgi:hypothetical protein
MGPESSAFCTAADQDQIRVRMQRRVKGFKTLIFAKECLKGFKTLIHAREWVVFQANSSFETLQAAVTLASPVSEVRFR